jgi:hypothetical protein
VGHDLDGDVVVGAAVGAAGGLGEEREGVDAGKSKKKMRSEKKVWIRKLW